MIRWWDGKSKQIGLGKEEARRVFMQPFWFGHRSEGAHSLASKRDRNQITPLCFFCSRLQSLSTHRLVDSIRSCEEDQASEERTGPSNGCAQVY
jgi:hypothetical protein